MTWLNEEVSPALDTLARAIVWLIDVVCWSTSLGFLYLWMVA